MEKKLFYTIDNGDTAMTAHLDACMEVIKAESPANQSSDDNLNQWTITPVWLTDEEFESLPEAD